MPAFCARWPDGSFSIVEADDKTHALIQLDELGDEPAELWQMQSCLLDFELTESGTFRIRQFVWPWPAWRTRRRLQRA